MSNNPDGQDLRRKMLLITTLFISVMAAIDMTIVTVALPYMAGNLSATPDEITWVVTMFAVGQAIVIGITGHLSRLLGRKRLAIIAVVGFVGASMLCGMAGSLEEMVIFRLIQGAFAGPLIPLSQSMLVDAYPPEQRNKVLSLWAMGVMGGPAIGPAIGGYLAQNLDWRWNFWVNLPVGVCALLLILRYVDKVEPQRVRTDWLGLLMMATFLVGLQVTLDQGNQLDWWSSLGLVLLSAMTLVAFVAFIGRGMVIGDRNIINLSLFTNLNFAICTLLITIVGSIFLALLVVSPELFVDVYGWEVVTAGYVIGSFGLAGFCGALLSSRLVAIIGIRAIVALACLLMASGWYLFSLTNLNAAPSQVVLPGMMIEFGMMLIFPLLAAQAFSGLPASSRDEAAGLFNLTKTIGFSLGTTFITTLVYRGSQTNWNIFGSQLSSLNPGYEYYLQQSGLSADQPALVAAQLSTILSSQTSMVTMVQAMQTMAVLAICAVPLALLLKTKSKTT